MTNKQIEQLVASAVATALASVLGQTQQTQPKAAKVASAPKRSKAGKVPAAKLATKVPATSITELAKSPLQVLMNRALAEAASSTKFNANRKPLVAGDIRLVITSQTNAALKLHCRQTKGTADAISIVEVSQQLVTAYDKHYGKGSAVALIAYCQKLAN